MRRELAPAKVNLFLHVTGRRTDGYHLLDSLVVFAGAADAASEPDRRAQLGNEEVALDPHPFGVAKVVVGLRFGEVRMGLSMLAARPRRPLRAVRKTAIAA